MRLEPDMWIGDTPTAEQNGQVIQYTVIGAPEQMFVRDMTKTGEGVKVVLNKSTQRWEVVHRRWQISRDNQPTWQDRSYDSPEEALEALRVGLT